jgi:hypothetical protein
MWELLNCSDNDWKKLIRTQEKITYLQDVSWALHSRDLGWAVKRWQFVENGEPICFLQGSVKIYFGVVGILWFPDWIIGDISKTGELGEVLKKTLNLRYIYIRLRTTEIFDEEKQSMFMNDGWYRPNKAFGSGLTMELDLTKSLEEIHSNFGKKWRKSLRKSNDKKFDIKEINSPSDIYNLYEELKDLKSLKKQQVYGLEKITSLMKRFDKNIFVLGAFGTDKNLLAIRGVIIQRELAIDTFAAAGNLAREMNVSHALVFELVKYCKKIGCTTYDLGGIDPINNAGVYNFKKGTGANTIRQLGEFEWSNNIILKLAINALSKYR